VAPAFKVTDLLALAVQLSELVPSGHGNVIEALDTEVLTMGATFGGGGSVRAFRCPNQS